MTKQSEYVEQLTNSMVESSVLVIKCFILYDGILVILSFSEVKSYQIFDLNDLSIVEHFILCPH